MKISIVQGAFLPVPPLLGGAVEKMWFRLGQEFARQGHSVCHISRRFEDLPRKELINQVKHIRVDGYSSPVSLVKLKGLDLIYSIRAVRAVPDESDIVVTNTFWSPMVLPSKLKARAYVDVQRMPKGQLRWYGKAARFRANSSPVANAIVGETPANLHSRVVMIPNPLPFSVDSDFDSGGKTDCLLFCGRVHPEKGLELLIEAMRRLRVPWPLRIVGPWQTSQGGGGEEYAERLRSLSSDLPITFTGPIHDIEELNQEYKRASLFVYPSVAEMGETFGLAPLEAMAWGAVPVVSDLACFKDFIGAGRNGLVFDHRRADAEVDLASKIQRLMDHVGERRSMALEAIKVRETHSPSTIAKLFLEDFQKIIEAR